MSGVRLWSLIEETASEVGAFGGPKSGGDGPRQELSSHVRRILAEKGYCKSIGVDDRDALVKSDHWNLHEVVPPLDLDQLRADIKTAVLSFSDVAAEASPPA